VFGFRRVYAENSADDATTTAAGHQQQKDYRLVVACIKEAETNEMVSRFWD
jgi:hypothetical protein